MNYSNTTELTGLLHHLSRKKEHKYFPFSVRHENLWTDGTTRKDFLNARAFDADIQEKLKTLDENTPLKVKGILRSSKGSGELYLDVQSLDVIERLPETPENHVTLTGYVHVIKAQNEGENGSGKYTRFAVRQEDAQTGRDFIVVRVYDEELRGILSGMNDGDPVTVKGTFRSSRGSGVNYVRCGEIAK